MVESQDVARGYMPPAASTDWETPRATFDALWDEFGPFGLDPCGQKEVHYSAWRTVQRGGQCYDGSTEALDGLVQPWHGRVFLNPPYGRAMPRWIEKAVAEVEAGRAELVVALIPARTDTKMWHEYILREAGYELERGSVERRIFAAHDALHLVRFLPGRQKFGGSKNSAPFPSAVVVWQR